MNFKSSNYKFIPTPYTTDRKLYKYYSNVEYAVNCIKKRMIHLDDPKTFNDPFDATFSCPGYTSLDYKEDVETTVASMVDSVLNIPQEQRTPNTQQIIRSLVNYQVSKNNTYQPVSVTLKTVYEDFLEPPFSYDEFCENINAGFKEKKRVMHLNCKISCFSEVYDSILMWSYYANCHRGVCIEFDLSRLSNKHPLNRDILSNISMVHYTPIRPDPLYSDNQSMSFDFLTTKADVWSHEHEWRLICDTDEEFMPFDCISKVIIGSNFDEKAAKYKELLKAVHAYEDLPIYKCVLSSTKYQIELKCIYDKPMFTYYLNQQQFADSL